MASHVRAPASAGARSEATGYDGGLQVVEIYKGNVATDIRTRCEGQQSHAPVYCRVGIVQGRRDEFCVTHTQRSLFYCVHQVHSSAPYR